jgi:hypothetical protein
MGKRGIPLPSKLARNRSANRCGMEERKHCARAFCANPAVGSFRRTGAGQSPPAQPVIYDNDWSVTDGGYVAQPSLMPLLTSPSHRLLALTTVSGDFWRDEGTVSVLRFLEIVGAGASGGQGRGLPAGQQRRASSPVAAAFRRHPMERLMECH